MLRILLLYPHLQGCVYTKGPKESLLECLSCLNSKNDLIKLTNVIHDSSISFLDLFLYKDANFSTLQFSTYQKPLNKYLCIPFESFHLESNKRTFIRGELMRYTRNISTFKALSETRDKFWKRLRTQGYPVGFLLPLFKRLDTVTELNGFRKNASRATVADGSL